MCLFKQGKGKWVQVPHEPVAVNGFLGSFSVPYRKRDVATALSRGKVEKHALPQVGRPCPGIAFVTLARDTAMSGGQQATRALDEKFNK